MIKKNVNYIQLFKGWLQRGVFQFELVKILAFINVFLLIRILLFFNLVMETPEYLEFISYLLIFFFEFVNNLFFVGDLLKNGFSFQFKFIFVLDELIHLLFVVFYLLGETIVCLLNISNLLLKLSFVINLSCILLFYLFHLFFSLLPLLKQFIYFMILLFKQFCLWDFWLLVKLLFLIDLLF